MGLIFAQVWFKMLHENGVVTVVTKQPFMVSPWLVQVLYQRQKSERPPFRNGSCHCINNYGIDVTTNNMTSFLNFLKIRIYQKLVQNMLVWDSQMDIQTEW
jgi:hypothetical protein